MYQETVTLIEHKVPWSGTNKFGKPSSLNVFTATDGREFQTFKGAIAAQLLAALQSQSPVTIQFEAKPNGEFINYDVTEVVGLGAAGSAPAPQIATAAPQAAPVAAPAPGPAPTPLPLAQQEKQVFIMRQKAAGDAIMAFGVAGIDPVVNNAELLEYADSVLYNYYVNGRETETVVDAAVAAATEGPVA